jgi:hypothetical protein
MDMQQAGWLVTLGGLAGHWLLAGGRADRQVGGQEQWEENKCKWGGTGLAGSARRRLPGWARSARGC